MAIKVFGALDPLSIFWQYCDSPKVASLIGRVREQVVLYADGPIVLAVFVRHGD